MKHNLIFAMLVAGLAIALPAWAAPEVEVLHWWTSGGEAKAVKVLKDEFTRNGGKWTDSSIAGGGGGAAMQALKARVLSGNPPSAVQLKGPFIQEWHETNSLNFIDDVAKAERWNRLLLSQVRQHMLCDGHYCAVPVNVHRIDWIWASPVVMKAAGVRRVPRSWKEFNEAARKVQKSGNVALAHGGQAWQDATVFETVVLGVGGKKFYQSALVDLEPSALNSNTMVQVFDQMRTLRGFVDKNFSGRDWNLATAMIIRNQAAFQIMGDWAKGEFLAANKKPGRDFLCSPAPGKGFLYNVDSFAMFKVKGSNKEAGQKLLARLIMGKKFQETFNLNKGSIPARLDVSLSNFDSCAKLSNKNMRSTARSGGLLPSMAHDMAIRGAAKGAILDVVTNHFNSNISSNNAAKNLAAAVARAR